MNVNGTGVDIAASDVVIVQADGGAVLQSVAGGKILTRVAVVVQCITVGCMVDGCLLAVGEREDLLLYAEIDVHIAGDFRVDCG